MSWLGNLFTGNNASSTSASATSTSTGGGTFAGVGQTTPSTLPYTTPTTHIGTTVPNGGYASGPTTGITGGGTGTYIPNISTTGIGIASPATTGVYNPNTYSTINTMPGYGTVHISGPTPSISTDKVKIDLNELGELINVLKERFLIITPNFEKHEKYAALKKAYDHYKLLEAMLSGEENGNK